MRKKFRRLYEAKHPGGPGLHAIGDIHGMLGEMITNLHAQGVVDSRGHWVAGDDTLVFTGDLTDRGPDGYEVVKHVYDIKNEAEKDGGKVVVVMGNHDAGFVNCCLFLRRRPALMARFKQMFDDDAALPEEDRIHHRKRDYHYRNNDRYKQDKNKETRMSDALALIRKYLADKVEEHPLGVAEKDRPEHRQEIEWFWKQLADMLHNGAHLEDILKVAEDRELVRWAVTWPVMYYADGVLFQHCNSSTTYRNLLKEADAAGYSGSAMDKVNALVRAKMTHPSAGHGLDLWSRLTDSDPGKDSREWLYGDQDHDAIVDHMALFAPGATKVAHGHDQVWGGKVQVYAKGKAVNLDTGLAYEPKHFGKTGRSYDFSDHAREHRRTSAPVPPKKDPPKKEPEKKEPEKKEPEKKAPEKKKDPVPPKDLGLPKPGSKEWERWVAERAYYIYQIKHKKGHEDHWDTHKIWYQAEKDIRDYIAHLMTVGSTYDPSWWKGKPYVEGRDVLMQCIREAIMDARMLLREQQRRF